MSIDPTRGIAGLKGALRYVRAYRDQVFVVKLGGDVVGGPEDYLDIMLDAGCDADAWETTYYQLLPGTNPVLEWVRGTGLRPVLAALSAADAHDFEAEYSAGLAEAYPAGCHGTVFPFRRVFAVARKRE